jgi:uncharacterized membrane protein
MNNKLVILFLFAAMILIGAVAFPFMPNTVPIHYGPDGMPNGYGPRWIAAFSVPLNSIFLTLLLLFAPRIARLIRRKQSAFAYKGIRDTLRRWCTAYLTFMLLTQVVLVMGVFGYHGEPLRILTSGVGILIITFGNEMGRLRWRSIFGMRAAWLMKNEAAWTLAHRRAGRIFFISGAVVLLSAALLPMRFSSHIMVVCLAAVIIFSLITSYTVAQRTPQNT